MWTTIKDDRELEFYQRQLTQAKSVLHKNLQSRGDERVSAIFIDRIRQLIAFLTKNIEAYEVLKDE